MKINATQCETCKQVLVSVDHHDFTRCGCGATAIDGGFHYNKVVGSAGRRINTTRELASTLDGVTENWVAALICKLVQRVALDNRRLESLEARREDLGLDD
jgi:hypothetical protein